MKRLIAVAIGIVLSVAAAAGQTLTISSPLANSSVTSPVTVSAVAESTAGIRWIQLYIDGSKYGTYRTSAINVQVSMSPGTHTLLLQARDNSGVNLRSTESITVVTSSTAPPPPSAPSGPAYYVSSTGSDANPGTQSAPFATIQQAANVATAGYTVYVAPGTYTENSLTLNNSGTASAHIRFLSTSQGGAAIRVTSSYQAVKINGSYIDFDGFDVAGNTGSCLGIVAWGSYTRIRGNLVHDVPADLTNVCGSNGGAGIDFATYSANGNEATENVVHDIGMVDAPNENVHCIYATGYNAKVMNNIAFRASGFGITAYHNFGNLLIYNNTVFNNLAGGIVLSSGGATTAPANVVIANNITAYNKQMPGIQDGYGIEMRGGGWGSGNVIENNLVYGDAQSAEINDYAGATLTANVTANPMFVNYTGDNTGDYHLQATSPAINMGTSQSAPATDRMGGSRPYGSYWDAGAYEFGGGAAIWAWY